MSFFFTTFAAEICAYYDFNDSKNIFMGDSAVRSRASSSRIYALYRA